MMKMVLHMIAGVVLAYGLVSTWDFISNMREAAYVTTLQTATPQEWLAVEGFEVLDAAEAGSEPTAQFTLVPTRNLNVRMTVASRDALTGESLCSGGTATLAMAVQPIEYSVPISELAGVEKCLWPHGVYKTRITWTMIEPATQIEKRIVLESNEFTVP